MSAPMSAEEAQALIRDPEITEEQVERVCSAVAAMAEREAALVARHAATERDACLQAERANELESRVAALAARITHLEERDMMLTKQIVLYAAEGDALRAKVEALREDAERWGHARMLLTEDDIEISESFRRRVSEDQCKRADAAIDAARAAENRYG